MKDDRIEWIDFSKGVAITLVIIGHCFSQGNNLILTLIYGFHVPYFFVISGYLYGRKSESKRKFSVKNCARKLLVPYFVYDSLFALFVAALNHPSGFTHTVLNKLMCVVGLRGVSSVWFLPCMALVNIVFLKMYKRNSLLTYVCSFILLFVGIYAGVPDNINPWFSGELVALWRGFVGIAFFALGFCYGTRKPFIEKRKTLSIIVVLGGYGFLTLTNGVVSLANLEFNNGLLYFLNSILGSWILVQIAVVVTEKWKKNYLVEIITFVGKQSLFILCTHGFVIEVLRLVDYKVFGSLLQKLGIGEGIVFGIIISVCELVWLKINGRLKKKINTVVITNVE